MAHILIIDDNTKFRSSLKGLLRSSGYDVSDVDSGEEGLSWIQENETDVILTGSLLPGRGGGALIRDLKKTKPETRIVVMSAALPEKVYRDMADSGAELFLEKPFELSELKEIIKGLI